MKIAPAVTPYVGVWIETQSTWKTRGSDIVTPYVGVWIETILRSAGINGGRKVTPYVGVWIETF